MIRVKTRAEIHETARFNVTFTALEFFILILLKSYRRDGIRIYWCLSFPGVLIGGFLGQI